MAAARRRPLPDHGHAGPVQWTAHTGAPSPEPAMDPEGRAQALHLGISSRGRRRRALSPEWGWGNDLYLHSYFGYSERSLWATQPVTSRASQPREAGPSQENPSWAAGHRFGLWPARPGHSTARGTGSPYHGHRGRSRILLPAQGSHHQVCPERALPSPKATQHSATQSPPHLPETAPEAVPTPTRTLPTSCDPHT